MIEFHIAKALVRHDDKFVLLRRRADPIPTNIGKWECPGGKIKQGETPKDTILRECQEELGVPVKVIEQLAYFDYNTPVFRSRCFVFLVEAASKKITLGETHSKAVWLNPEEVKNQELVLFASLLLEYFNNPERYNLLK